MSKCIRCKKTWGNFRVLEDGSRLHWSCSTPEEIAELDALDAQEENNR